MNVYLKIHQQLDQKVVAVCDSDVIGKVFSRNNLEVNISETFYKGDLVDLESAIKILEKTDNFNIAGKIIVDACITKGIISEHAIIKISDLPIAMKFKI